jgi:hypothetical protein
MVVSCQWQVERLRLLVKNRQGDACLGTGGGALPVFLADRTMADVTRQIHDMAYKGLLLGGLLLVRESHGYRRGADQQGNT